MTSSPDKRARRKTPQSFDQYAQQLSKGLTRCWTHKVHVCRIAYGTYMHLPFREHCTERVSYLADCNTAAKPGCSTGVYFAYCNSTVGESCINRGSRRIQTYTPQPNFQTIIKEMISPSVLHSGMSPAISHSLKQPFDPFHSFFVPPIFPPSARFRSTYDL